MYPLNEENKDTSQQAALLASALAYAQHGWHVITVNRDKKPYDPSSGGLMRNWYENATAEPAELAARIHALPPGCGIGVVTGAKSDILVLDLDQKNGKDGVADVAELEKVLGPLPPTLTAITPSGGRHLVFKYPCGLDRKVPNKTGLGSNLLGRQTGIDIRADGGQVVVAPTERDGVAYEWLSDPLNTPLAELPDAWLQLILGQERPRAGRSSSVAGLVIAAGARNDTLFREAAALRGKGVREAGIAAELHAINAERCDPPLDDSEVDAIAQSVMRCEPNPRYELNDTGNARRFADKYRDLVRYEVDTQEWRIWSGRHWEADKTRQIERLAQEVAADIDREAALISDQKTKNRVRNWAKRSGDRARLTAMVNLAGSDETIVCRSTDFDNVPGLLPVLNGVIDLKTGELLEHDRARLITRLVRFNFVPGKYGPKFEAVLDRALPERSVQTFLQRLLGHALHGDPVEQVFAVVQGRGANSKSLLFDTFGEVVKEWVIKTPTSTFLDKDNEPNTRSDLVRLQGSRIVIGSEVKSRRKLDAPVIKAMTGDREMTARTLYKPEETFRRSFVPFMITNPLPGADEADNALWRRLVLIPFDNVIPEEEQDPHLLETLVREEAEAVLAWLVQGAIDYAQHGLEMPEVLQTRTAEWRRRVGSTERYLLEECVCKKGSKVELCELHWQYQYWCHRQSIYPCGIESFRERADQLGYVIEGQQGRELVVGLKIGKPQS